MYTRTGLERSLKGGHPADDAGLVQHEEIKRETDSIALAWPVEGLISSL